jgi:hypothetical protein
VDISGKKMKNLKTTIPYHLVTELRSNIEKKYSNLPIQKSGYDIKIFVKKKLIVVLSRYVLINELRVVNPEVFNFNDFENSIININSSEYRVYGYADYEDFIYLEKGSKNMNYVFFKFYNNFRQVKIIENIKYKDLLINYKLDKNDTQLKIPIGVLGKIN